VRAVDCGVGAGDPVGQEVEFGLAADEAVRLQERVGVRDERFGRLRDVADVVEGVEVGFAQFREAVDGVGAQVGGRGEIVDDPFDSQPPLEGV
jgi:hypothetical protein